MFTINLFIKLTEFEPGLHEQIVEQTCSFIALVSTNPYV